MVTPDLDGIGPGHGRWSLRVLGPIEVRLDGELVEVQGVARSLLALLIRSTGQVVSVESLVDGLWGSRPPAGAERAVASYISRLRKALAASGPDVPAVVVTRPPGYLLAIHPTATDVTAFAVMAAQGRRALAIGQPQLAAARLAEALELWRGEAYSDVPDAAFVRTEAQRLEELRLSAIEAKIDAELAAAAPVAPAATVGELQSLVVRHPHRERFWIQLITSFYRLGRQADALAAYQRAREHLVEDLGVEPGPELRAAELAVLAGDPVLNGRPVVATELPEDLPGAVPGCVGRDDELAWLEAALDAAAVAHRPDAPGEARLVVGGPSIGKSRLVAELAHRAARRGVVVRYGQGASVVGALSSEPDRLTLVIVDDLDRASAVDIARVAGWVRNGRGRPVLTVLTATDVSELGELPSLGAIELTPLTDLVAANLAQRLDQVVAEAAEPQRRLASLREDIVSTVINLGNVRAAGRTARGRDVVPCPYKGLAHFETADADLFHGRERLVAELVARLVQASLLAVVGASGSGKSSVVRAGLLPALAAGVLPGSAAWPQVVITPAGCRDLRARLDAQPGDSVVLVVDQFEEVFTALEPVRRAAFLTDLVHAVDSDRVTAVLTLRSDFYGRCAEHPELADLVTANCVLVRPLATDELRRAIERPAAAAGLLLEDGLVDRLIDDVRGSAGGLPLLSTSLLSLWERRSGRMLTLTGYREAGGVAGAVEQLGERAYATLATEQIRACARRMLVRLADTGGEHSVVRRRATRAEIEAVGGAVAPSVLAILADRRLVTISEELTGSGSAVVGARPASAIVEVAHEALLTEWPRLRAWLDEDAAGRELRSHLTPAATAWAREHDDGDLYRGARLVAAQDWANRHPGDLTAVEREFLEASQDAVQAEDLGRRRTVRRLRQMLVAVAAAFVVAVAGGVVAVTQVRRADAADVEADARRLAAQALVERDLGRALLLGVAAVRLDNSAETRANLVATLNRAPGLLRTDSLPDGDRFQGMAISPDGTTLALSTMRGVIELYDAASLRLSRTLIYPRRYAPRGLDFSPDGKRVVTFGDLADADHGVIEWDVNSGTPIKEAFGPMSPVGGAVLADGDSVAVLDGDSDTAEVWSLRKRERVRVLPRANTVLSLSVSADRRTVVLGHGDSVSVVDGLTGTMARYPAIANGGALSPDGRTMLVGEGPDVGVWDLATQTRRGSARQHTEKVRDIGWSADGTRFVTTSDDRTVIVWDAATLRPVNVFTGMPGRQVRAAYSRDGKTLFTAGEDGAVYAWDLTGARRTQTPLDPAGSYTGTKLDPANASAAFDTPHGRAIVVEDGVAFVVDATTGKPIGSAIDVGSPRHQAPELSADGSKLALGLGDGRGRVWDVTNRILLLDIYLSDPRNPTVLPSVNAGISGDGRTAAFASYHLPPINRTDVAFYDVLSGRRLDRTWSIDGASANRIAASPDGRFLAVTTNAFVAIWDLRQRKEVARLTSPARGSALVARFSPDSRFLAVGNGVGRPTLWRVADWGLQWQAEVGHNGYDVSVSFSPDGTMVASSGTDSKIFLYDVATGDMVGGAYGPDRNNWLYAEFRSDRNELVGYFDDGSMAQWDVDPESQIHAACQIAGRELTEREWNRLVPGQPFRPVCPG